jgi:hypothetical protein
MKKNSFYSMVVALMMGTAMVGVLSSCTKDDNLVPEEEIQEVTPDEPQAGDEPGAGATLAADGMPTITGADAPYTATDGVFKIGNISELTISGNSEGYMFDFDFGYSTITLDNVTATHNFTEGFIFNVIKLYLILTGDNTITCTSANFCIDSGELKLSCTGDSATLTLTPSINIPFGCGINSLEYLYNDDCSILAADGFTVTREEIDNGTWKYTVTKT